MCVAVVLSLCACTNLATPKEKYKASFLDLFDTASTIIAYDNSQEEFDRKYKMFYDELATYDHLFDIYNHYDGIVNLYDVNEKASVSPVQVDEKIIDMLSFGKEVYAKTDGNVNICFGSVLQLWHNEREIAKSNPSDAKLPDKNALIEANKHTNINDLVIDKENNTVFFNDPDMRLDVGAIAKGYAVQKVTEFAKEKLWSACAISIGGNVSTFGYKEDDGKTKWRISIENPDTSSAQELLMTIITDKCVVTSGDYQRFYMVDNKKYCHIINKDTLMPSEYVSGVSVICDDSAFGDAMSTALFNMPIDEGVNLVNSLDGIEAVWVDKEYNKTFSNGFDEFVEK